MFGFEQLSIRTSDSPITIYIQHPIPIPAPGEKNKIVLKPMMLTKKVRSAQPLFRPILIDIPFTGTKEDEEIEEERGLARQERSNSYGTITS
jgi:hypothetical protein